MKKCANSSEHVNHPEHYNKVPGIECIDVAENFGFCLGNAIKYIWRSSHKGRRVEDLEKAVWYVQREIHNIQKNEQRSMQTLRTATATVQKVQKRNQKNSKAAK